jgi:5-methylcytosine-specific restriction endonuclease McrA
LRIKRKPNSTTKKPIKRTPAKKAPRVPKTRNAGTQTEASFWGGIKNMLRQKSRWWKPIQKVKLKAKREYTGPNKKQKFEYQCNHCKKWFPEKEIAVDHIVPVGSLKGPDDIVGVIERLFCEEEGLQVLCSHCHEVKTVIDIENIRSKFKE